jgi:hypothetical protein
MFDYPDKIGMLGTAVLDKPPVVLDRAGRVAVTLEEPGQIVMGRCMPRIERDT